MAVSVGIQELNGIGGSETYTDLTSARYCTIDSAAPGTNNAIPIPTAGYNWSYWKTHALYMSGTFTQLDNVRWYTDGTIGWNLGTSGELFVGLCSGTDKGIWVSNLIGTTHLYNQASGIPGMTGISMVSLATSGGHPTVSGYAKASTYVVASPLQVDSVAHVTSGDRTKAIVTQISCATDATQGKQTSESVVFRYDEI